MPRLFFALDITPQQKETIAQWRDSTLSLPFKKIPASNFHITLAFIGNVGNDKHTALISHVEKLVSMNYPLEEAVNLQLTQVGLFKRPQVLMIAPAPSAVPSAAVNVISSLANELSQYAKSLNIFQENRSYQPHVSLYRKAKYSVKVDHVDIIITAKSFSLYQSTSHPTGVQYHPISTWPIFRTK